MTQSQAHPPRDLWVGSIGQFGLAARDHHQMIDRILARMEQLAPMQPDVICLPEAFPFVGLDTGRPAAEAVAEAPIGPICAPFSAFAREHACYVICPIYTRDQAGHCYNAAVVLDRQGDYLGEYRKTNPTDGELEMGLSSGPVDPPVFDTDLGRIGIQICFDVNWPENWLKLRDKGAQIVFWPSAFGGGQMLNGLAWLGKYYVVTSTRFEHPTKIVTPLGDDLTVTGRAGEWVCEPINLDYAVVQSVVEIRKLERLRAKYGRAFRVTIKHVEAWALVEGLKGDLSVAQALAEFGIEASTPMLGRNTRLQDQARPV